MIQFALMLILLLIFFNFKITLIAGVVVYFMYFA
jgi:hypothetical protein